MAIAAPRGDLGADAGSQLGNCLQGGLEIGVRGEQDPDVVLAANRHGHEVDGQRNIDPLLTRLLAGLGSVGPTVWGRQEYVT